MNKVAFLGGRNEISDTTAVGRFSFRRNFFTISLFADVRANIVKDVYVLPVAELASTKTYPDIVEVENDFIKLELLPNRGRAIARLLDKTTNLSFFYNSYKPDPMVLPGGLHSVEFGGCYSFSALEHPRPPAVRPYIRDRANRTPQRRGVSLRKGHVQENADGVLDTPRG